MLTLFTIIKNCYPLKKIMYNFSEIINSKQTLERFYIDCHKYEVKKQTYDHSYPEFVKYFGDLEQITKHNLIIGINFTYGWMPTIFHFRSDKFEEGLLILNNAKKGIIPKHDEIQILIMLFNNSLVGTTKLLHFINPSVFAIWDSRVYRYLTGLEAFQHRINNYDDYKSYLAFLDTITSNTEYDAVHENICNKTGYRMTKYRTAELIMYINGGKTLLNSIV